MPASNESLSHLFEETAASVGHLVAEHARLARLEILESLHATIRQTARFAVVIALAMVGYLFIAAGVGLALAPALGPAGAALLIGGIHAVAAAIGLGFAMRPSKKAVLDESAAEVVKTVSDLAQASRPVAEEACVEMARAAAPRVEPEASLAR